MDEEDIMRKSSERRTETNQQRNVAMEMGKKKRYGEEWNIGRGATNRTKCPQIVS
jgi:hypothetical protein